MNIVWFSWKDKLHPKAGGAETVTHELIVRFVQEGHQVVLLTSSYRGAEPEERMYGYTIVRRGTRWSVYAKVALYFSMNLKNWADLIIAEVNSIPFFTKFYSSTKKIIFIHQTCREVWFYQMSLPLSLIGFVLEPSYLRLLSGLPFLTVSESVKSNLINLGIPHYMISVLQLGITLLPVAGPDYVNKYDRPTIVTFGADRKMKRVIDVVIAFELAKVDIPELHLVIIGYSENNSPKNLKAQITRSKYTRDITCHNYINENFKKEILSSSHLICSASVKEGWGLVITEAASQSTPAIVYDVDGLRDSVQHNDTGIVCSANPASLAAHIVDVLTNPQKYKYFKYNAWFKSRCLTFENTYSEFRKVIESILQNSTSMS